MEVERCAQWAPALGWTWQDDRSSPGGRRKNRGRRPATRLVVTRPVVEILPATGPADRQGDER